MQNEINAGLDAVKLAPGGAYLGLMFAGVSISDWVAVLTGVYILAQLLLLVPKYIEVYYKWRSGKG